jgi:hypothetical protein
LSVLLIEVGIDMTEVNIGEAFWYDLGRGDRSRIWITKSKLSVLVGPLHLRKAAMARLG